MTCGAVACGASDARVTRACELSHSGIVWQSFRPIKIALNRVITASEPGVAVFNSERCRTDTSVTLPAMPITDRAEFERLMLQIERDLMAQAHLRLLLTAADSSVTNHLEQLQAVKARMRRAQEDGERARG